MSYMRTTEFKELKSDEDEEKLKELKVIQDIDVWL